MSSNHKQTSERDQSYGTPYSTAVDNHDDADIDVEPITTSHPTTQQSSEKHSVLDELLPLPTTSLEPHPHAPHKNLLQSLRRVTSLSIIVGFLLSIVYIASTSPAVDQGVRRAELAWTRYIKLHGKVFEDVASESVKQDSGMEVVPVSSGEESTTVGTLGDEQTGEEGESVEDYVWGRSDPVVDDPELRLEPDDYDDKKEHDGTEIGGVDWARYTFLRTLGDEHVDTNVPGKRVMFVGDVHGMYDNLQQLLTKVNYDASKDFLIHVGDLVAKGPDPLKVLKFMRKNRVRGVRGNHDEKVIEWRNWMVWAGTRDSNRRRDQGDDAAGAQDEGEDTKWRSFIDTMDWQYGADPHRLGSALSDVKSPFPKDWEWRSEHWKIARDMGKKEYEYLVSLPLALHIPSLHTVVVHAGLLGRDPTKKADAADQPYSELFDEDDVVSPLSRHAAELAVFSKIKQNRRPYTLMNIRSVLKTGRVTKKSNKGTPWSDIWQQEQARCKGPGAWALGDEVHDEDVLEGVEHAGIEMVEDLESRRKHVVLESLSKLNCSPLTVIYGHAAGRGLDIKQFSKGLDSGCVYGHQMTALVLGDLTGMGSKADVGDGDEDEDEGEDFEGELGKKGRKVRVGDQRGCCSMSGVPRRPSPVEVFFSL